MAQSPNVVIDNDKIYRKALLALRMDEYRDMLGIKNIENVALRNSLLNFTPSSGFSHFSRLIRKIQPFKYVYIFNKTLITTTCFKMQIKGTSAIYGYLYTRIVGKKYEPVFVSFGGAMSSQDGEYRSSMIQWKQFMSTFEKFPEIFEPIEQMTVEQLESRKLTFQLDTCYAPDFPKSGFEDFLNISRVAIKLYQMCWFCDYIRIEHQTIENHINPAYQWIMYQKEGARVYKKIIEVFNQQIKEQDPTKFIIPEPVVIWNDRRSVLMAWNPTLSISVNKPSVLNCGQKLFPISQIETIRLDDITFNVWREIYILTMATNLVMNLISPCFPFINNWFFVQNAHEGIYDNFAMHEKFRHSDIATTISDHMREVDSLNYIEDEDGKAPLSSKFLRLSYMLNKSTLYADSNIKLSANAVCVTTEHVGRTMRDLPHTLAYGHDTYGFSLFVTELPVFKKHIFELIHALYQMNKKSHIVHGDLHTNNMTLYRAFNVLSHDKIKLQYKVVYITGDTAYVFKQTGVFACVIDFSRAILGDYAKIEHEFSPRFAELYFREQTRRVLHFIYYNFPDIMEKDRVPVSLIAENNFPLLFKMISVIDTYYITKNIHELLSNPKDDYIQHNLANGCLSFLEKISARCEQLFRLYIDLTIAGNLSSPDDIQWPNLQIIQEFFTEFKMSPEDIVKNKDIIVEVFNDNNDLIYDITDYDNWCPVLKVDKEAALRKEYGQPPDADLDYWYSVRETDDSSRLDKLVQDAMIAEGDVLDFADWMIEG